MPSIIVTWVLEIGIQIMTTLLLYRRGGGYVHEEMDTWHDTNQSATSKTNQCKVTILVGLSSNLEQPFLFIPMGSLTAFTTDQVCMIRAIAKMDKL
jgi:hypothetical protein